MPQIDRVVFGDNQFFGINHMSLDKAQAQAERFTELDAIFNVYDIAFEQGIRAVMLNSNARAGEICDRFRANKSQYGEIAWYPSIPYPHKYANLVAERGMVGAVQSILTSEGSMSALGKIASGGLAVMSMDAIRMMKMLIDQEMTAFKGLNVRVIFLQNIIVDLMLGFDVADPFIEYCNHIRKKYGVYPGLITQNLPLLRQKLIQWGIHDVVICTSINKIGYVMSPSRQAYEEVLAENDGSDYAIMAMATLASGAIPAPEAYEYINKLNLQSVVFGASSRGNIEQTVKLIR